MVSSHYHRPDTVHHIPRYLALTASLYVSAALPVAAYANAAAIGGLAAAAASALGAAEGIAVPAAVGAGAAAAAVGAFALAFCATSYIMGTDLCSPSNPETGGGISAAINQPSYSSPTLWATGAGQQSDFIYSTPEAAGQAMCAYYNQTYVGLYNITSSGAYVSCRKSNGDGDSWDIRAKANPNYGGQPQQNSPDVAGDNIANNPRAAAGVGGAAAAKARGASDSAAESAARAAAAATGTGNPSRDRAAGNTGAAAGAAAAAAESAGGSKADVDKAAKDAANTAAAAADKAAPQDKTCQSNGASVDGRYCTDATAQPKPSTLPVYCTWAVAVCAFIDWVKAEPEVSTDVNANTVQPEKDTYDNYDLPSNPHKQVSILFGGQCPSDVNIPLFLGINWNFSYKAACDIAGYAKYAFIAAASISAVFIVTGNRETE